MELRHHGIKGMKKGSKNLKKKGVSYFIDKYGHVIRTTTYTD